MYHTIGEPRGLCPLGSCLQTDSLTFGNDPHFKKGTDIHVLLICSVKQLQFRMRELMCPPPGELFFWGFRLLTYYENLGQGHCV